MMCSAISSPYYRTRSVAKRHVLCCDAPTVVDWRDPSPSSLLLADKEDESFVFSPNAPAEFLLCHSLLEKDQPPEITKKQEPAAELLLSDLPPLPAELAAAYYCAGVSACSGDAALDGDHCCCDDCWTTFSEIVTILAMSSP